MKGSERIFIQLCTRLLAEEGFQVVSGTGVIVPDGVKVRTTQGSTGDVGVVPTDDQVGICEGGQISGFREELIPLFLVRVDEGGDDVRVLCCVCVCGD